MKFYTLLVVTLLVASTASAESRFVRFDLPFDVSIEVPQNWWLLSGDFNTTIEAAGEAATKLAGINLPSGRKINLLRANSMPRSTYAAIAVNATDSDIPSNEIRYATTSDLKKLEKIMEERMRQVLTLGNLQFLNVLSLEKRELSEHVALVFSYRRSGPNGPVIVSMTRLFVGSKEISFNLSYRESEEQLWKEIIEYMKKSIKIRERDKI